jgi:enoyl-CoA hydratase
MTYQNILVEHLEGKVGLVRLNRPNVLNALNGELMLELMDAFESLDRDESIGCHVITGNEKAFAAGADIKEMAEATPLDIMNREIISQWHRLSRLHKPVIAAVSGWCVGGGCELAMACDMIVASETAKFGQPEINLGVIPGAGGTQRLTRAVGKAIAMEMILNNRTLTADEAYRFGLANRVVSPEVYLDEAIKLAREIASRAPIAVRLAKEAINKAYESTLAEGLDMERRHFCFLFATEDQKEGMAAFVDKRPPQWRGK